MITLICNKFLCKHFEYHRMMTKKLSWLCFRWKKKISKKSKNQFLQRSYKEQPNKSQPKPQNDAKEFLSGRRIRCCQSHVKAIFKQTPIQVLMKSTVSCFWGIWFSANSATFGFFKYEHFRLLCQCTKNNTSIAKIVCK